MDYAKIKEQYRQRRVRVRALFKSGMSAKAIADKLGITRQRVHQIVNGR